MKGLTVLEHYVNISSKCIFQHVMPCKPIFGSSHLAGLTVYTRPA